MFRYEWQIRTAIHAHGTSRLSNDPGLVNLTAKYYISLKSKKILESGLASEDEILEHNRAIEIGRESEKIIINYCETLLTAINTRIEAVASELQDPHPCSLDFNEIYEEDYDKDYENLINCCQ